MLNFKKGQVVLGLPEDVLGSIIANAAQYCLPSPKGHDIRFVKGENNRQAFENELLRRPDRIPFYYESAEPSAAALLGVIDLAAVMLSALRFEDIAIGSETANRFTLFTAIVIVLAAGDQAFGVFVKAVAEALPKLSKSQSYTVVRGWQMLNLIRAAAAYDSLDELLRDIHTLGSWPKDLARKGTLDLRGIIRLIRECPFFDGLQHVTK